MISLDFELFWGVRDLYTKEQYGANILGARLAIPKMIALFNEFGVRTTFATVGMLFFETREELLASIPSRQPSYRDKRLSPYDGYLRTLGANEEEDPYHFGASLISQIKESGHEIGCHTFSHYYCLEPGQTLDEFHADLVAAKETAARSRVELNSLVFPRNQYSDEHLAICAREGILTYRGNEKTWSTAPRRSAAQTRGVRAMRLMDSYLNLTGHHAFELGKTESAIVNIPSSRFLRPFTPRFRLLENLRLKRITNAMTFAARNNRGYHLWWHPHNFGLHLDENLLFLRQVLEKYRALARDFGFTSMTMESLARMRNAVEHKN